MSCRACCPESYSMSILYPVSYLDKLLNGKDVEQLLQMNCIAALAVAAVSCKLTVFSVVVLNFGIIVVQLFGPPSPPFPTCSRAVAVVTFSLLATAGLFCNCSSTVELEVISHHYSVFTILNLKCNFFITSQLEPLKSLLNLWTTFNSAIKLTMLTVLEVRWTISWFSLQSL